MNKLLRLGILPLCLLSVLLSGQLVSSVYADDNSGCSNSVVAMSPPAMSAIAKQSLDRVLNGDWLQEKMTEKVADTHYKREIPLHKAILGMDFGLRNFSSQKVKTEVTADNLSLERLKFGPAKVICEGMKCKVRVPVSELSIVGDVGVKCLETPCTGQDIVSMKKLNFQVRSLDGDESMQAYVEYDVVLKPGAATPDLISLDPNSAHVKIPPYVAELTLGLNSDERKQVEARYAESYARRKAEYEARMASPDCFKAEALSPSPEGEELAQNLDDVRVNATADSLKPYISNSLSFTYYAIAKASLRQQEVADLERSLDHTLWVSVGEAANKAFRESPYVKDQIEVDVPAITPATLFRQDDLTNSDTPRQKMKMTLTGSAKDSAGNLVLQVRSCDGAAKPVAASPAPVPVPSQADLDVAKKLKGKKFDLAGSVSISEINQYLREIFADQKKNDVYFESLQRNSLLAKLGLNQKVRLRFEEPPQIISKFNKDTQQYEAFVTLKVSGKPYIFGLFREFPSPFLATEVHSKVQVGFDPATKSIVANFDKTRLLMDTKDPLTFAGDFITFVTPLLFVKSGILHGAVIPVLNNATNIKDATFAQFAIQDMNITGNGSEGTEINFSANVVPPKAKKDPAGK